VTKRRGLPFKCPLSLSGVSVDPAEIQSSVEMFKTPPSQPSEEAPPPEVVQQMFQNARLSIPSPLRIPLASGLSFSVGMALGMTQGGKMAGLRFRAEHAHKLPTTSTGWFLYHKSKNYNVAYGGVKEGLRMGGRVCFWTTLMFAIEDMFDSYRGTADAFNTVLSCVTVAGGFSAWRKCNIFTRSSGTRV
jgi:hypothetical protein